MLIGANNNLHKELLSEDEKEEDKEHHSMASEDERSVDVSNEDVHEGKVTKSNEAERE